jgi:hypothetical protein
VKKVLFDEDVPRQLRRDLPAFEFRTVQERGWSSVKNGELLRTASMEFDVLVTADKNLQHQQNTPTQLFTARIKASMCPRYRSSAFFPAAVREYSVLGMRPSKDFLLVR